MKQYRSMKNKHPGAILLFQVGDFYETFEEDAHILSATLGLTLTKRNNGQAKDIDMAGFPVRALDTYLPRLMEAGFRVAICDQTEAPSKGKKLVRREITQIATPAVHWSEGDEKKEVGEYLGLVWAYSPQEAVLFLLDVMSSGTCLYHQGTLADIDKVLNTFTPIELLVHEGQEALWGGIYTTAKRVEIIPAWYFDTSSLRELFREVYGYAPPNVALIHETSPTAQAFAALLSYLRDLHQQQLRHIAFPQALPLQRTFILDPDTQRNLEVLQPLTPQGKSLLSVLNLTTTAAGTRLLRTYLTMPLRQKEDIESRLAAVQVLYDEPERHKDWQTLLRGIGDLERRVARLSARKATPREIATLYFALRKAQQLLSELPPAYPKLPDIQEPLTQTLSLIEKYLILGTEPIHTGEKAGTGEVIREGIDPELDRARYLLHNATRALEELAERESKRLNIPNLKIQENRQLGYVFHITASYKDRVPPEYRLRQQLAQGIYRYTSDALDKLSAEIATAQEKVEQREKELYQQFIQELHAYTSILQKLARWIACVDVMLCFAIAAHKYKYTRPTFTDEPIISIQKGRHPVIEQFLPPHQPYQPNHLFLHSDQRIMLLTGPNMSGKSAYMRQNALILLMAQIGSFVPAEKVEFQLVSQIFSRVGASDNIAAGQSTFMVEMQELTRILHQATKRSFVILDEIGRGTSTYDGLAIAWAVLEYLHQDTHCRPWVLFATHYHELTALEKALPRLGNYHLAVEQRGDKLIFLHQLRSGAIRRSFGLTVAEMAGLPPVILQRAQALLKHLEKQEPLPSESVQPNLFALPADTEEQLRRLLLSIDPNTITPIEALFKLQELRNLALKS
ncbi:MAG: DNA mismatch repair protein MutS [Bacteroidia bacterium]|nr:DNA mismatch repair protein MutS [Bacteroidia bacterium]MDW8235669.1 DNA mismatch repair protein MutS [Bacteroidia bacterium]